MLLPFSFSRRVLAVSFPPVFVLFVFSLLTACSQESSFIDEQRLAQPSPETLEERAHAEQALMADELGWSFAPHEGGSHPIEIDLPARQYADPQILVALEGQITSELEIVQVRWLQMDGPEGVFLNAFQSETAVWVPAVERRQELRLRLVATDTAGRVNYADTRIVVAPQEGVQPITLADLAMQEGQLLVSVHLTAPVQEAVQLDYVTQDGSARAGEDYEYSEGALMFAPGEQTQVVAVPLLQAWQADGRYFYLNLSGEMDGELFARAWVLPLAAQPPLASKPEASAPVFEGESDQPQLELEGERGALRAYLQWPELPCQSSAVLQMRVTDACGNELSLTQPNAFCEDVVGQYQALSETTHNLVWPDTVLGGEYQIVLEHLSGPGTEYTVRLFWGDDSAVYSGYLGSGEQAQLTPLEFEGYMPWAEKVLPTPSQPNSNVAAGAAHSMALDVDQMLWAWGDDTHGALSQQDSEQRAVAVAAGAHHSLALGQSGDVWGWGNNAYGQAEVPDDLAQVVSVAAGERHSLLLQNNGRIFAWGDNSFGQTDVPPALRAKAIGAGDYHNLALRENGTLVAWGDNGSGQLVVPSHLPPITAIAAGGTHSLALTENGRVVAWGDNQDGQSTVPEDLTQVVAIAAGQRHSLALRADGTVVAWGADDEGQSTVPEDLREVVAIAGGGTHSLALTADGKVVAWGSDFVGQVAVPDGLAEQQRYESRKHMLLLVLRGAQEGDITAPLFGDETGCASIPIPELDVEHDGYAVAVGTSVRLSQSGTAAFSFDGPIEALDPVQSDESGSTGLRMFVAGGEMAAGTFLNGSFHFTPTITSEPCQGSVFSVRGAQYVDHSWSPTNTNHSLTEVSLAMPESILPNDLLVLVTMHRQQEAEGHVNLARLTDAEFRIVDFDRVRASYVQTETQVEERQFITVWQKRAAEVDAGRRLSIYSF